MVPLDGTALADAALPQARSLAAESAAVEVLLLLYGGADPADGAGLLE